VAIESPVQDMASEASEDELAEAELEMGPTGKRSLAV
jgi:hypothetical protein